MLVGPDLTVSRSPCRSPCRPALPSSIGDTVKNLGAADAGASVIRFYLSTNTSFDSSDMLIGSRNVPAIAAGGINSGTTSVVIPSGLSGSYYIFAVADATGVVAEASEGNNSFLRLVQINGG